MHSVRRSLAVLAAALFLIPAAPGKHPSEAATARAAKPECAVNNAGLTLPRGFCAMLVADSVTGARHLVVQPNGDLFVSSSREGVIALRDTTGDGRADIVQKWGGFRSSEVVLRGGYAYADFGTGILRFPIASGALTPSGPADTLIAGLPGGGHGLKTFTFGDDGTLYVNIGSRTNACQVEDRKLLSKGLDPCVERETRAGIWAFRSDKTGQTAADGVHFGTGIRNAVAMAIHPTTRTLYVMQHGRDNLAQNWPALFDTTKSAETPAEEMFEVKTGDDFGWPYCYYDRQLGKKIFAPEYGGDGKTVGKCADYKGNAASFPGHWAPNGLLFYTSAAFPERYRNGAFVAFHGSWNRAPLPQQGFKVVFQPMRDGKASGDFEVFADGFRSGEGTAARIHRPVGLATGPEGSLYVTDDAGGRIWRIMYTR